MGALDARLRLALDASIGWYEDLTALHGVASRIDGGLWMSVGPPPPLHSDVVTLEPEVATDAVDRALEDRPHWGFKDSFASVRPSGTDVTLLFAATWIHRPPTSRPTSAPRVWTAVTDATELAEWHSDTSGVLLPGILDRGHFRLLARRSGGRIVAGAVARLGTGAVDLSNVHAHPGYEVDWTELVADVEAVFPGRALVGYERDADLVAARDAGFEQVGELRVWVR